MSKSKNYIHVINHDRARHSRECGMQEKTGFPRIRYGAGLVKPGKKLHMICVIM